ncbi:ras-related protein Rab-44-like isoform X2 [Hyla sarda]|uniref:ras-related protein Rab-44-like isoform X2 n=1 Tax=Hyla sarda TaxID=327740 RepID=UPI0024C33FEB|nr:ras-related protein Rab-44-like isoform X2 [Hyla sarda]
MDRKKQKGRKMGSSRRILMKQEGAAEVEAQTSPKSEDFIFNEMTEKIQQLLSTDGTDTNLFITRQDMEKISGIIFFSVEDLEDLFDELNKEGKGYLTYEEFTSGLKSLINSSGSQWNQTRKRKSTKRMTEFPRSLSLEEADTEERKQFKSFMEQLGAHNVFEDESEIWKLWTRLGQEEPHLLENLEEFLAKVTNQIKEAKKETETLEIMLKKRITEHNVEVQRIYEEMDQQMREEMNRLTKESNTRSSIHDREMRTAIELKNKEVQQLLSVQNELEKELSNLQGMEHRTKSENEMLKRTNQDLEQNLEKIRDQLSEAEVCLSDVKQKMIQHEKEIKDDEESRNISSAQIFFQDTNQKEKNNEQEPDQSDLKEPTDLEKLNTVTSDNDFKSSRSRVISIEEDPIQECLLKHSKLLQEGIMEEKPTTDVGREAEDSVHIYLSRPDPLAFDDYTKKEHPEISLQINKTTYQDIKKIDIASETRMIQKNIDFESKNIDQYSDLQEIIKRENFSAEQKSNLPNHLDGFQADPEHVYKIMFVGNSHVGKTSFLRQVHEGSYNRETSATVGIDYRIKSFIVDNRHYALQLWDTAGQERFYSITEQFFRKADGMVIMYDVTSRETFTAVHHWLNCIREKVMDEVILLLLGNKIDCDAKRQVTFHEGQKLAQEYKLLFTECSAASGLNITESLILIVRSLKEHEDNMKNNVVTLNRSTSQKKTSCCT